MTTHTANRFARRGIDSDSDSEDDGDREYTNARSLGDDLVRARTGVIAR